MIEFRFGIDTMEKSSFNPPFKFVSRETAANLRSLCVDSLHILDVVQDRRAVLPNLECLTISALTSELHREKSKGFLEPQWSDLKIVFDHCAGSAREIKFSFKTTRVQRYILPTVTMRVNISLMPYSVDCIPEALQHVASALPADLTRVEISLVDTPHRPYTTCAMMFDFHLRAPETDKLLMMYLDDFGDDIKERFPDVQQRPRVYTKNRITGSFDLQG